MSFIAPLDIGSKYMYLAHTMIEYLNSDLSVKKSPRPRRLAPAISTFFTKVLSGAKPSGDLEEVVHYRLASDTLNPSRKLTYEQIKEDLHHLSQIADSVLVEGISTPADRRKLSSFFSGLYTISKRNFGNHNINGKASSYSF